MKYEEYNKKGNNLKTWTYNGLPKTNKNWIFNGNPVEMRPSDDVLIRDIREHPDLQDKGFFDDIVDWLKRDAPRKFGAIHSLWPGNGLGRSTADLSYKTLCKTVYSMGFRASERLEKRMILGESNEWTIKYFEDFPIGSREIK